MALKTVPITSPKMARPHPSLSGFFLRWIIAANESKKATGARTTVTAKIPA